MSIPPSSLRFCSLAILGALLVAGTPILAAADARAETAATTRSADSSSATTTHEETIDQRIASLKTSLKITASEEADWDKVAQVMRDNASKMEALAASAHNATAPRTAPDDLKSYAAFAQAHVDGLNRLATAFDTLYASMPDAQKKNADQVFQSFGHEHDHEPAHS